MFKHRELPRIDELQDFTKAPELRGQLCQDKRTYLAQEYTGITVIEARAPKI